MEVIRCMAANVIGNLGHVCIIKCRIDLVEDEEWCRLVLVAGKETVDCQPYDIYILSILTCG
jgi:hypothetical protein